MSEQRTAAGMNRVIQSLWIGPRLSTMEQLCIRSFLRHGHDFHLYAYNDMENIPEGTVIKDGNEILPKSLIGAYTHVANFSDVFRYKLLSVQGGWYIDMDAICLHRLDFPTDYVFARTRDGVSNYVMKAPANSAIMSWCVEQSLPSSGIGMRWGDVGGRLLTAAIEKFSLREFIQPEQVFCSIPWDTMPHAAVGKPALKLPGCAHVAHFCHEMWVREGYDRDARYPPESLYERLKERYNA